MSDTTAVDFTREIFPAEIDNTMRTAFASCPKKFYWAHVRGLAPLTQSIHLHAGGAFAHALDVTRKAFYQNKLTSSAAEDAGRAALAKFYGTFDIDQGYL